MKKIFTDYKLCVSRLALVLVFVLWVSTAFGQKFYYDGGYFEKVGSKWFEYKPTEKDGVWNWFDEVTSSDDNFYVIDNGLCKIAVPKTPVNDFYIMMKGGSKWDFKYKSVKTPQSVVPESGKGKGIEMIPRDRRAFHRAYFNEGGVCILAAYCLLLDYANSTDSEIPDFDSYDVMSEYLKYQNTLEPTKQLSASEIRGDHRNCERIVSDAINGYCMARGWSGLIQVGNFHKWLKSKNLWTSDVEIVERGLDRIGRLNSTLEPLPFAYEVLTSYLKQNANPDAEYDYAAILIYYVESAKTFHAIFLGCDKDGFFMRGPNFFNKFTDTTGDFDFKFNSDAPIAEYMVMKIKRPERSVTDSKWKMFNESEFRSTNRGTSLNTLSAPIPVKSIRVDPNNRKNNKHLFSSIKMVSKSDPSFVVEFSYAPEEKSIKINDKLEWGGRITADGLIEYDLKQICHDLEIVSYTTGFNFDNFYYQ